MLHDTSVHHVDAVLTVGVGDTYALAPDLAADAIDEGLELMSAPGAVSFRPAFAELRGKWQPACVSPSGGVPPPGRNTGPVHADQAAGTDPVRNLTRRVFRLFPPPNG